MPAASYFYYPTVKAAKQPIVYRRVPHVYFVGYPLEYGFMEKEAGWPLLALSGALTLAPLAAKAAPYITRALPHIPKALSGAWRAANVAAPYLFLGSLGYDIGKSLGPVWSKPKQPRQATQQPEKPQESVVSPETPAPEEPAKQPTPKLETPEVDPHAQVSIDQAATKAQIDTSQFRQLAKFVGVPLLAFSALSLLDGKAGIGSFLGLTVGLLGTMYGLGFLDKLGIDVDSFLSRFLPQSPIPAFSSSTTQEQPAPQEQPTESEIPISVKMDLKTPLASVPAGHLIRTQEFRALREASSKGMSLLASAASSNPEIQSFANHLKAAVNDPNHARHTEAVILSNMILLSVVNRAFETDKPADQRRLSWAVSGGINYRDAVQRQLSAMVTEELSKWANIARTQGMEALWNRVRQEMTSGQFSNFQNIMSQWTQTINKAWAGGGAEGTAPLIAGILRFLGPNVVNRLLMDPNLARNVLSHRSLVADNVASSLSQAYQSARG